eukprot:1307327-Prymnesium_polylepis.1
MLVAPASAPASLSRARKLEPPLSRPRALALAGAAHLSSLPSRSYSWRNLAAVRRSWALVRVQSAAISLLSLQPRPMKPPCIASYAAS